MPISTPSGSTKTAEVIAARFVLNQGDKGELYTVMIPDYGPAEFYSAISHDYSNIYNATGEPVAYMSKRIEDFDWNIYGQDTSAQRKTCEAYMHKFMDFRMTGYGLYIYSRVRGSGKTLLACCIANEIVRHTGMKIKFISITDYIQKIKDKEDVSTYRDADFLVLDDFGCQAEDKDWIREVCFSLVDHRHARGLSTIYTSNVDIDHCSKDTRITDRIGEISAPVRMPEVPVRRNQAKKHLDEFMREVLADE